MRKKCLDTYALVEIAKGNPEFFKYLSEEVILTDITLAEFYAVLLREDGKQTAEYWFQKLSPYSMVVDKEILKQAVAFRYEHRQEKMSFFDAVGYVFSQAKGYIFVTGDKAFEKRKGVEYQK